MGASRHTALHVESVSIQLDYSEAQQRRAQSDSRHPKVEEEFGLRASSHVDPSLEAREKKFSELAAI